MWFIYFGLLSSFRLRDRFVQTLTCVLAGHMIVHLFAFPLLAITPWLAGMQIAQPLALLIGVLYLILTLVLTVWQFMITVHIYKHALGIEYFPAVLASLGLLAANILVVSFGVRRENYALTYSRFKRYFYERFGFISSEAGFKVTGSDAHCYPPVSDLLTANKITWTEGTMIVNRH